DRVRPVADAIALDATIVARLDRVGLALISRVFASEFEDRVACTLEQLGIFWRDDNNDLWWRPGIAIDGQNDSPADQVAQALVPVGIQPFGDHLENAVSFVEVIAPQELGVLRNTVERLLKRVTEDLLLEPRRLKDFDVDHVVLGNPARRVRP